MLELLLAITLGALVLSVVYSTFSVAVDTQRRIARVASETQAWRFFAERLRADVKNLALGTGPAVSGDAQALRLVSVPPNQALQQISYRYQRSAAGGQIRRHYRSPGEQPDQPRQGISTNTDTDSGVATLVFDGVERFGLRYLGEDGWRDSIGADDTEQDPLRAIECTIAAGGRERRLVIAVEVQRVPG